MPRLPSDSVLLVLDHPDDNHRSSVLISAWREAKMPIMHSVHDDSLDDNGALAAARLLDEPVFERSALSAFVATNLETALTERGATTLVVCGALTHDALLATVRHAIDLGYRVLIAADACGAPDSPPLAIMHDEDATVTEVAALQGAVRLASAIKAMRTRRVG